MQHPRDAILEAARLTDAERLRAIGLVGDRMTVRLIVRQVAEITGVPAEALFGRCRRQPYSRLRQLCYLLAYERGFSLPQIGRAFGRDHTTVLYGIRRMRAKPR